MMLYRCVPGIKKNSETSELSSDVSELNSEVAELNSEASELSSEVYVIKVYVLYRICMVLYVPGDTLRGPM